MRRSRLAAAVLMGVVLGAGAGRAAVDVSAPPAEQKVGATGQRTIQTITLANEINSYTLVYDYNVDPAKPGEATSDWWGWTAGYIPLGKIAPTQSGWYWQAFMNWYFDDEDLSKRPAQFRVVRGGGQDGWVELAWDTPKVKATLRWGMGSGSDKLLLLGSYEPKVPVKTSRLTFVCYPAAFELPHNRAVTTASGTVAAGGTVDVDLAKDRWILYEDTTPDRAGAGSSGMILGTPEAFAAISIPVGNYGIVTTATLKPEARSFALGLYDFPSLPDYQMTREYYGKWADKEAAWLGVAAATPDEAMAAWPMDPGAVWDAEGEA